MFIGALKHSVSPHLNFDPDFVNSHYYPGYIWRQVDCKFKFLIIQHSLKHNMQNKLDTIFRYLVACIESCPLSISSNDK